MNPDKVFPSTTTFQIVIHLQKGTFSIKPKKLDEIHLLYLQSFLQDYMSRCEFQSFLGKLLYISRCVRSF